MKPSNKHPPSKEIKNPDTVKNLIKCLTSTLDIVGNVDRIHRFHLLLFFALPTNEKRMGVI